MRYLGGKKKLAGKIADSIKKVWDGEKTYVEPFCGSCAVAGKISPCFENLILNDKHSALIALFKALKVGQKLPEEITEERYKWLKKGNGEEWERAFAGFGCSFGGKFFGGYARGEGRNFTKESKNGLEKLMLSINAASFFNLDYRELPIPENSLIYCDPPYTNTTKYSQGSFDTGAFWEWVRKQRNTVVISEYTAPEDIPILTSFDHFLSVRSKNGSEKRKENLYIWKGKFDNVR